MDNDNYEDLDAFFDQKTYTPVGSLLEQLDEDAYTHRYTALKEDLGDKPVAQFNTVQENSYEDLDSFMEETKPQEQEEVSEEPQEAPEEGESSFFDQAIGVGKEAVAGVVEGIQGVYDTYTEIEQTVVDWGLPNFGIKYSEQNGLEVVSISKEETTNASLGNINVTQHAPTVDEHQQSMIGDFVNEATEFITGYALAGTVIKPLKAGQVATAAVRGAVADFADHEPEDGGLLKFANSVPELEPYIADFLVAQDDDSRLEQRFKLAVEGVGLGILADKLFDALVKAKNKIKNKHNNNKTETNVKQQETPKTEEPESTGTPEATSEAPAKTEDVQSGSTDGGTTTAEAPSKAQVELDEEAIEMSDEIQRLHQMYPDNPDISRQYDDMAASGRIADRPSYMREISPEAAERVLRDIELDPDAIKDKFYNLDAIDTTKQIEDALHYAAKESSKLRLNKNTPTYRSHEDTVALMADDLMADKGDIMNHLEEVSKTVGNLDVWVSQSRALQHQAASEASSMAERIIAFEAPMKEQIEFVRRLQQLEQINQVMTGIKTGTGRGLSSMQIPTARNITPDLEAKLKQIVCNL